MSWRQYPPPATDVPVDVDAVIADLKARLDRMIAECHELMGIGRRSKDMVAETSNPTPSHEAKRLSDRNKMTRLAARQQPQAQVFAAASEGEARSRFSHAAGPVNPYVIGTAAPVPAPAEKPLPADLRRLHDRKVAVRDDGVDPDASPAVKTGIERMKERGHCRPIETCDGQEPHLRFNKMSDAAKALGVKHYTISNAINSSTRRAGGRLWRDVPNLPQRAAS